MNHINQRATRFRSMVAMCAIGTFALPAAGLSSAVQPATIPYLSADVPQAAEVNAAFTDFAQGRVDLVVAFEEMRRATEHVINRWSVAQLMGTSDAVVGRYADARKIKNAHRPVRPYCATGTRWPDSARTIGSDIEVLLINEDHLNPMTRAAIIEALPVLKDMGFKRLALESIPRDTVAQQLAKGFVPDAPSSGVYLREPVEAQLVHRAVELGFQLVPYDTDTEGEDREASQAAALNRFIKLGGGRLVVVAGHAHVSKADGWLGEKLEHTYPGRIFSIDQTRGAEAQCDKSVISRQLVNAAVPDTTTNTARLRVDAEIITPATMASDRERATKSSWLTLAGLRHPLRVNSNELCPSKEGACLIEAHRREAPIGSVPEDRFLAMNNGWSGFLFVTPGRYVIKGLNTSGHGSSINVTVP